MPPLDREVGDEGLARRPGLTGGLQDAPEVGVAAVQRGLHERRVGDRARDRLDGVGTAVDDDPAHAARALAVRDDHQRELPEQRVERLAEARARRPTRARS